jgi:hypothetical protein
MNAKTISNCAGALLLCLCVPAEAGSIIDQAELDSILGSHAITDTFANVPVLPSGQLRIYSAVNSTTVAPINCRTSPCTSGSGTTVGPGLVTPGVTFDRPSGLVTTYPIDFNGAGYFAIPVNTISGIYGPSILDIDFTTKVDAFGFDLWSYKGFASAGTISVYDTHGNLLDTTNIADFHSSTAAESVFFGWEGSGGIGQIVLSTPNHSNYLSLGTVAYGAVPEPSTWAMMLVGFTGLAFAGCRRSLKAAAVA